MEHSISLISTLAIGFGVALVLGFLAEKLKVPALVGYLLAGILISPQVFGFEVDLALAEQLADIGVMLLMFGVGLHFSISDLLKVKGLVVPGAIMQMTLSALVGFSLFYFLADWTVGRSLIMGLCLSCASTVVVLKALEARSLLQGFDGSVAVGWLIVQDTVTVLMLVLLPPLASMLGGNASAPEMPLWRIIAETLMRVVGFVMLMLIVGKRLLPWILLQVARTGSRELFTLCVLASAIGIAFGASEIFQVSFALGAFFAGMVMRESQYAHRAAQESLPLRDAFSVIFFVGVGMMFNPAVVLEHPVHLLGVMLVVLLFNPLISFVLTVLFRYPLHTAVTLSACLSQIGEFSFILAGLGTSLGLIGAETMNLILATSILTIAINPLSFLAGSQIQKVFPKYFRWARIAAARPDPQSFMPDEVEKRRLTRHVVIVGFGSVGAMILKKMQQRGIPVVVIDRNDAVVTLLRSQDVPAIMGEATDPAILLQAHVQDSSQMMVTITDELVERRIVETARLINPDIDCILLASSETEQAVLASDNLGQVVLESDAVAEKIASHIVWDQKKDSGA